MRMVKWGVLGTADILARAGVGMQWAKHCCLYAIAGRSDEKVAAFQKKWGFEKTYLDYEELLRDPEVDAVYIPLPNNLHFEWVKKALELKKHVLCEKPMGVNAQQTREMFRIARENGVLLTEAFAYLHTPYMEALAQEIQSGSIGEVVFGEASFLTSDYDLSNIRMRKETYGGSTYDLGVYGISFIQRLFDEKPTRVQAIADFSEEKIDTMTTIQMTYRGRKKAIVSCGMILEKNQDRRRDLCEIVGTKGKISCADFTFNGAGELHYEISYVDGKIETKTVTVENNYGLEMEHFSLCVLGEQTPVLTEDFSVSVAEIVEEVLQAIGYEPR